MRGNAQLGPQQSAHLETFAACMRAHGVADMPAVNGNGRPGGNGTEQVDLKSPAVKAAIKTCLPTADLPFRTSRGPYSSPMRAVGAGQGWLV